MTSSPNTPIRIVIVDDHGMVRFGLRGYIEFDARFAGRR